MMDVPDNTGE